MIPPVEYTLEPTLPHAGFMKQLSSQAPGTCIIDVSQALGTEAAKVGIPALRAPLGHYSPAGNRIFAQTVRQGLHGCGVEGA